MARKNWSRLSEREMAQIERAYRNGKEPAEIAPAYGLKAKQVSDQAYRKAWPKPGGKRVSGGRKKASARRR